MKGRTLAVIVVLGLAVVGWVVFALVGGDEPEPRSNKRTVAAASSAATPPSPAKIPASKKPAEPRTTKPPNPSPQPALEKPNITIEEAREQFDEFIAELDREIAKTEEVDRDLSNEAWVGYYKRGHESIEPLRRLLDPKNPEHSREIAEKYELVREKLQALEPRPKPTG